MVPTLTVLLLSFLTLQVLSQKCRDTCMSITGEIPSQLKDTWTGGWEECGTADLTTCQDEDQCVRVVQRMQVKSDEDSRVHDFTSSMTLCGKRETVEQIFCQEHSSTYQDLSTNGLQLSCAVEDGTEIEEASVEEVSSNPSSGVRTTVFSGVLILLSLLASW
ncbi:hypothetical protein ACHWQZ_G013695 [Mnemiopsis leidyi]